MRGSAQRCKSENAKKTCGKLVNHWPLVENWVVGSDESGTLVEWCGGTSMHDNFYFSGVGNLKQLRVSEKISKNQESIETFKSAFARWDSSANEIAARFLKGSSRHYFCVAWGYMVITVPHCEDWSRRSKLSAHPEEYLGVRPQHNSRNKEKNKLPGGRRPQQNIR